MATRLNVTGGGRLPLSYPPRAGFEAQLTNSLIPTSSVGAITYTRATPATVIDNEGVIRNCISGEARFEGARRVQNGLIYSQTLTDPSWITGRSTVTLDTQTINGIPVFRLINDAVMGTHLISKNVSFSFVAGNKYIISCIAKAGTSNYIQLLVATGVSSEYVNFDLSTGTATAGNTTQSSSVSLGNGFYRISLSITAIASGVFGAFYSIINSASASRSGAYSGAGEYVLLTATQFEDVTGQSIQTAAEYVSTNVLSSPFHGANVDGVKYFDTDVNGVAIPKTTLKGLLVEGARTNLFSDSEDFSLWTKAGTGVITPNATIAPDGRMTADLLTLSTSNEGQSVNKTITTTASIYGYSVYVKPNGHYYVQLLASAGINSGYMNFDLLNGVVGTSSSYTGRIEALPNGWYRLKVITPTVLAATGAFIIAAVPSASASRGGFAIGTGSSGVYLWGAQLELGPSVSSYIPTTTTTVTRNIDSLIMNTKNAIDTYGACSFIYTLEDNEQFDRRAFSFTGNTTNRLQFQVKRAGSGANLFYGDGSGVPSVTPGQDVGANNVVIAWTNLSNVSLYMNNIKYNSGVAPNLVFTTVDIGSGGGQPGFGCIKNVRIWKTRPTDTELLNLSNTTI